MFSFLEFSLLFLLVFNVYFIWIGNFFLLFCLKGIASLKMKDVIMNKIDKSFSSFEIFIYFFIKAENIKVITSSIQEKKHAYVSLQVAEV